MKQINNIFNEYFYTDTSDLTHIKQIDEIARISIWSQVNTDIRNQVWSRMLFRSTHQVGRRIKNHI